MYLQALIFFKYKVITQMIGVVKCTKLRNTLWSYLKKNITDNESFERFIDENGLNYLLLNYLLDLCKF